MKHCPTCGSTYTDDTLVYCMQDGATLQGAGEAVNPLSLAATLHSDSQGQVADAPTERINLSSDATIEIPAAAMPTAVYQAPRVTARATSDDKSPAQRSPNTTRVIAITVAITILLLAGGGFGAWMLFRGHGDGGGRERRAEEANSNSAGATAANTTGASNVSNVSNASQTGNQASRPDKGGRWLVILGSFTKEEKGRANERLELVRRQGFDARLVSSDDYPNLKSGLWVIMMGPYNKNSAEEVLGQVRPKVKDAYTKSGW